MGFGVGTVRTAVSMEVIFMVGRSYNGRAACFSWLMKLALIIIASFAVTLAGCNRTDGGKSSAAGGSSMQTPKGGATGQASEGSTDDRAAPKRPASK
jgi:predicted small secreted protein